MEIVGEGVYGTVFMAKDLSSNQIVALKKMRLDEGKDQQHFIPTISRCVNLKTQCFCSKKNR